MGMQGGLLEKGFIQSLEILVFKTDKGEKGGGKDEESGTKQVESVSQKGVVKDRIGVPKRYKTIVDS